MSRFKAEGRKHHQNLGSSYMGAGRTESSFTFRSKTPFAKVKQIYGEHLEGLGKQYSPTKETQHISPKLRKEIKERIIAEQKKALIRQVIVGSLLGVTLILLFWRLWNSEAMLQMFF